MLHLMPERRAYAVILLLYLLIGFLFAQRTPDWQAPDEPAHYNYIAQVAAGDLLPVIQEGDWDQAYLDELKATGFDDTLLAELDTVRYENHQPPLYYWLAVPIFNATDGNLLALRLYSVVLGAMTVMLSYAITRTLLPERPLVAVGVMALVAFVPQHVHMLASVNNDALAGVLIAALLWVCLRYVRGDFTAREWIFGLLLGLVVITKTTAYLMAGVVLLAILIRWWRDNAAAHIPADLIRALVRVGLPAGLFALAYWGRNISVYGFPDFLGLGRHDAIVIGQLRTATKIANTGMPAYLQEGWRTTFNSFWGQFGWLAAPMDGAIPPIYTIIGALVIVSFAGLLVNGLLSLRAVPPAEGANTPAVRRAMWLLIGLVMILSLLQFAFYNTTFVQFQGRYIFTALIPFAIFMTLGIERWRLILLGRWSQSRWVPVGLWMGFAVLDLYLIWRVIPGALA